MSHIKGALSALQGLRNTQKKTNTENSQKVKKLNFYDFKHACP